jgi:ATP-dependent DNA ligase
VKLYSRPGNDLTYRSLPADRRDVDAPALTSCIIDGEAVACDDNGVTLFNRVRYRRHDEAAFLYAFDLIELNGDDLRRDPLDGRKATLEMILANAGSEQARSKSTPTQVTAVGSISSSVLRVSSTPAGLSQVKSL